MDIRGLLDEMVRRDASDLHITAGVPPTYRVENDLTVSDEYKGRLARKHIQELAFSILNDRQREVFMREREMNLAFPYPGVGRFRVNLFYQRNSIGLVIRRIRQEIKSFEELGLPSVLRDISMSKRGLVLVAGTAGSGKSTTLASMIDYRSSNAPGHIITIEDPIEFLHSHKRSIVNQREIGIDTHSYKHALQNALRQAPDVILIGEIRDADTMQTALSFAETGHLCLSTLHAHNASQTIDRILTFFPLNMHEQVRILLSLTLRSVISQRLLPGMGGRRVAAVEVLLDTQTVKDLIRRGEVELLKESMGKGVLEGMQTFDQSIFDLYRKGRISYDTALSHADSAGDLRLRIKTEGLPGAPEGTEKPPFRLKTG